jgi:hypothetical protein
MASKEHSFWHLLHPMQAFLQAFIAIGPLSWFTQLTYIILFLGRFALSSIMLRGHCFAQFPQPEHLSTSTTGNIVSRSILIASNWHTLTQSPQPRHPYPHPLSPIPQAFMAEHCISPL